MSRSSLRRQECFNSPYGVEHFAEHAETIAFREGAPYDVAASESESARMLGAAAKEHSVWLFGGALVRPGVSKCSLTAKTGSIPERDPEDAKRLYNTATVFSPAGALVAIHRKLHLFDIDVRFSVGARSF